MNYDNYDIPVDIPTEAQLDAVQNSQLFEGDIVGMPIVEEQAIRRLRDDPIDIDEASIFGRPVTIRYIQFGLLIY